jgi:hypothetical protein
MMDKLREELYECIERFGMLDPRTVSKSQELDVLIVRAMDEGGLAA